MYQSLRGLDDREPEDVGRLARVPSKLGAGNLNQENAVGNLGPILVGRPRQP